MATSSTTTVMPGDIVVPFRDIAEALKNKLTPTEINQLLLALAARRKTEVRPGELITADLMNSVLADILDLQLRIAQLEGVPPGAGQVFIATLVPGNLLQVGQELQIIGRNFDYSIGAARVYFDTTSASAFKAGSSDTLLVVDVPAIPNLSSQGSPVTLTVSNRSSSVTRSVTIVPITVPVIGPVDVVAGAVSPDPTAAGQNADFAYMLTSRANQTAEFHVTVTLTGPAWQDRIRLLDENKNVLPQASVRLVPRVPKSLYVRINPIPTNTAGTGFDLLVKLAAGAAGGDSGIRSYVVGQPTNEDNSIRVGNPTSDPPGAYNNGTVSLRGGNGASILLSVHCDNPGRYDLSLRLLPTSTGGPTPTNWILRWLDPSPTTPTVPTAAFVDIQTSKTVEFWVEPDPTASNSGRLEVKVQRQGATVAKTMILGLLKLP